MCYITVLMLKIILIFLLKFQKRRIGILKQCRPLVISAWKQKTENNRIPVHASSRAIKLQDYSSKRVTGRQRSIRHDTTRQRVITSPLRLSASHVAHTYTPRWQKGVILHFIFHWKPDTAHGTRMRRTV